jgi:hypothetical protein
VAEVPHAAADLASVARVLEEAGPPRSCQSDTGKLTYGRLTSSHKTSA